MIGIKRPMHSRHLRVLTALIVTVILLNLMPQMAYAERESGEDPHLRLAFLSDSHSGYGPGDRNLARAAELLRSTGVSVILAGGDQTERGLPAEYGLFQSALSPVGLPVYSLPGNHDVRWNGEGNFIASSGAPYRSINLSGYHLILLDTSPADKTDGAIGMAQLRWLEKDLATLTPETPVIVASHHPLGIGAVQNEQKALDLLSKRTTVLYLSGHSHATSVSTRFSSTHVTGQGILEGSFLVADLRGTTGEVIEVSIDDGTQRTIATVGDPLTRRPAISARQNSGEVSVSVTGLQEGASFRVGNGQWTKMSAGGTGTVDAKNLVPGTHRVQASGKDTQGNSVYLATAIKIDAPGVLIPEWQYDIGESIGGPLATDGRRFYAVGEKGTLIVLDAAGKISWSAPLTMKLVGGPIVTGGRVYVSTFVGEILALDAAEGTLVWRYRTPASAGLPATDGRTTVLTSGNNLIGLDKDGSEMWRWQAGAALAQTVTVAQGKVLVGSYDGYLQCLSLTGSLLWRTQVESSFYYAPVFSAPVVTGNEVIVGTPINTKGTGRTIHAFDLASGAARWSQNISSMLSAPVPVGDAFYCVPANGRVVTVVSGKIQDSVALYARSSGVESTGAAISLSPDGKRFLGVDTDGYVFSGSVSSPEDTEVVYSLGAGCYGAPVWMGNKFAVASTDGRISTFRIK